MTRKAVRRALDAAGFVPAVFRRVRGPLGNRDEICTRDGYRVRRANWTRVVTVEFLKQSSGLLFGAVVHLDVDAARRAVPALEPFGLRFERLSTRLVVGPLRAGPTKGEDRG